jgi:hypothetical protein
MADALSNDAPHGATNEWTLWAVAVSCALHPIEEYVTGWQRWASQTLLYLPFSSWAFFGARRDGIPARTMAVAFGAGTFLMLAVALCARSLNDS